MIFDPPLEFEGVGGDVIFDPQYYGVRTALGVCYVCAICGDDPDVDTPVDTCVVCMEEIHTERGAVRMNCCDQGMHRKCHERWRCEEVTRNCPVCRK